MGGFGLAESTRYFLERSATLAPHRIGGGQLERVRNAVAAIKVRRRRSAAR
jgi:hypothetical protein